MNREKLLKIVEDLTGKKVAAYKKGETPTLVDQALLDNLLRLGNPLLGWNELNELLLICNKSTISEDFFTFFFLKQKNKTTKKLSLKDIKKGIDFFRKIAMLRFGNFIYAFEALRKKNKQDIKKIVGRYAKDSSEILKEFQERPNPLHKITLINSKDTHFLGYLTKGSLDIDLKISAILQDACDEYENKKRKETFCTFVLQHARKNKGNDKPEDLDNMLRGIEKLLSEYFQAPRKVDIKKFKIFISKSLLELVKLHKQMTQSRNLGNVNTGIYLTWDYMDVYLATSMRKKWEFETISNFAKSLFKNKKLSLLRLRYFDPTQSAEKSRINKGLIEGLMLKRAKCTIYSIQDTDTIGKDSELASTLAQGKPVIAYVPDIETKKQVKQLARQPLDFFVRKLPLLYEIFEKNEVEKDCVDWAKKHNIHCICNKSELEKFLNKFNGKIRSYLSGKVWNSIETPWLKDEDFKKKNTKEFEIFCYLIATADKYFYNTRANTLSKSHPLALQVNLTTGVANGVLVVRKIDKCAELLYNILINSAQFKIKVDKDNDCICLKENISGCIFRAVTSNKRLTNSYWNFYLHTRGEGCYYVEEGTS